MIKIKNLKIQLEKIKEKLMLTKNINFLNFSKRNQIFQKIKKHLKNLIKK